MKFWEAMKALEEGLAVIRADLRDPLLPADIKSSEYGKDFFYEWELYSTPHNLSFQDVVEGLKEGKKFRRPMYRKDVYIMLKKESRITWNNGDNFTISIQDIEANDWTQIYD